MDPFESLPDREFYAPVFAPWLGWDDFGPIYRKAQPFTVVSPDRCWILYSLAQQAMQLDGNFYEAGVYRGGTAIILRDVILIGNRNGADKTLRLFDTFEGMPETDPDRDLHKPGDFSETFLDTVKTVLGDSDNIVFHPGLIPDTFAGLEDDRICFAHVDVDIYRSIQDCCEFIYPRLAPSGFMIFDDYGFPTCPGARQAVDEFFRDKPEVPLVLPTGQSLVTRCA